MKEKFRVPNKGNFGHVPFVCAKPSFIQSITRVVCLILSQANTSAQATFFPLPLQFTYTYTEVDTKRMTLHTTRSGEQQNRHKK